MLPGAVALVSSCILRVALGQAVFYDVSLRSEARARTRLAISGVLGEAEADPRLGLSLLDRRLDLAAAYYPRLMVQEQVGGLQVLHRASLGGTWLADRNWRAIASAQGSYGRNDFLSQSLVSVGGGAAPTGGPGPPAIQAVQPIPRLSTIQYVSGEVSLAAEGTPAVRYHASAKITGFVEGGAGREAQASLPLQRGGRLDGELAWTASRADVLASALALTVSGFSPENVDGIALVTETWRHTFTPAAEVWFGVGPAVTAHRELRATTWQAEASAEAGMRIHVWATGGAALPPAEAANEARRDRFSRSLVTALTLKASPIADRITGAVYERADGTLTVAWDPSPRWSLGAAASGGVVVQGAQAGDKIAAGDVHAGWSPAPAWEVAIGVRGFSQMPQAASTQRFSESSAYFALTARDRDRL